MSTENFTILFPVDFFDAWRIVCLMVSIENEAWQSQGLESWRNAQEATLNGLMQRLHEGAFDLFDRPICSPATAKYGAVADDMAGQFGSPHDIPKQSLVWE